jgi:hypothetical protein
MQTRPAADPVSRARSIHDKRPFRLAVLFALLHYLCLIAFLTCLALLATSWKPALVTPLALALGASLATWLISYLRRREVRCPLCKGTPLLDIGAVKHSKAYRLPPLNHGTTAVLGILFLNRFRCMYCGTPFDMLKRSSTGRSPR